MVFAKLSQILAQPVYPWLLVIYATLHLYASNLGFVIDYEVVHVLVVQMTALLIGFFILNAVSRNRYKSACILGLLCLSFSLSGHTYNLVADSISLEAWTALLLVCTDIVIMFLHAKGTRSFFVSIASTANLVSFTLVCLTGVAIVRGYNARPPFVAPVLENSMYTVFGDTRPKRNDSSERPDIYYIIPDGYPSDSWLQDAMNYDNADFSQALEERGFKIARHAQANYGATLVSLASILNMRHFNNNPSPFLDLDYLRLSIADSVVARKLKELGYTYIQLLSGYLIPSPIADINRDFTPGGPIDISVMQSDISPAILYNSPVDSDTTDDLQRFYKQSFISLYIDTTILRIVGTELTRLLYVDSSTPYGLSAPERFLETIENVESIVSMPEATFAMIHLMKPHEPTVFNERGELIGRIQQPSHQEYFAEFAFTNSKFLELIDMILDGSGNPPVIIFQADHGSTYGDVWTKDRRTTHFNTYSAYYLPETSALDLPEPFTLINIFPLILFELFESEYELQHDKLFELPVGYDDPFLQVDVTDEFAYPR